MDGVGKWGLGVFGSVVVGGRRAKKGEREQELIRQKRFGVCDYQVSWRDHQTLAS